MSKLGKTQQAFQDFLLHGKSAIAKQVCSNPSIPSEIRLAIYRNAYFARLEEALAHNFPLLKTYLGDEQFAELTTVYCEQHPSQHRSIRWFGDQLENFLLNDEYYRAFPYLAEMAHLEWTLKLVFDARDCTIVQMTEIAQIPFSAWENMRLYLQDSLHRLDFYWNVPDIFQSLLQERQPDHLKQLESTMPWVLWRQDFMSHFAPLTAHEAWSLDAVLSGATFGEIGEGLCQWFDEDQAALQAASLLKGWLEWELIAKVVI